ncbi:MAG TPA: C1 family peptidase [Pyrinomonadaceae bacterium]|nr:C1 family peptidase [Pyrinomonadaceae bacterium]
MTSPYLTKLHQQADLSPIEQAVLESIGIRTPEDLLSLAWNFPSLTGIGFDFAKLSFAANMSAPKAAFANVVNRFSLGQAPPPRFAHGAKIPAKAPLQMGYRVPMPAPTAGTAITAPAYPKLDFRFPGWAVKDQGVRGTCVAFSMVACHEHLLHSTAAMKDLSEQYLFWAIKTSTADPNPTDDGTWIEFARDALSTDGTCTSPHWPYVGTVLPANVTHATPTDPSTSARADAAKRMHVATTYLASTSMSGNAAKVINAMVTYQRPVAVSLPVFGDPLYPGSDNWNTAVGMSYGRVIDPPPTSTVVGGHAVCFTGFVPDASEPKGGWFILRNSWGTVVWANSLPSTPPYVAPEVGYGQISATYVDKYLMEMCVL